MNLIERYWKRMLCLAVFFSALSGAAQDGEEQLRFADGLMVRGMHEYAIREYQIFLEENPDYAQRDVIQFRIGECYRQLNNLTAAVRAYESVIASDPPSVYRYRAMLRRAEVYRMAGHPAVAAQLLREMLEEDAPSELAEAALYWLGNSLAASGEREQALEVWDRFLEDNPASEFIPFVALESGILLARGDAEEQEIAGERFQRVIEDAPDDRHAAEGLYHLARMAESAGDDEKAAGLFDDFWARHADDMRAAEARLPAAWVYHRVGRHADSLALCNAALDSFDPADSRMSGLLDQWYYLKGNNERSLGKHAAAAASYGELLQRTPESPLVPAATIEKAQSLYRMDEYQSTLQTMKGLRLDAGNRLPALWLQALAHDALRQDSEAIQNYRLIVENFPESEQAYEAKYRLALLYKRLGEKRQAAEYFGRVAIDHPGAPLAPRALMASGELLRSIGRHEEAVRDYGSLIESYPDHELAEEAWYRKAVGEAHLGRNEFAAKSFRAMLERFPESEYAADATFALGLLYFRDGMYGEAETVFEEALRAGPDAELRNRIEFRRALALQQLERDSEAADLLQRLLDDMRLEHFDPTLLEWLCGKMLEEGRPRDALRAADRLVESAADTPEWVQAGHALAGLSAMNAGDNEQARLRFGKALEERPYTAYAIEAAVNLGELFLLEDRVEEARRYFSKGEAYAQETEEPALRARALLGLGNCSREAGDLRGANRYYTLVGLTYDIPGISSRALQKAAATFESMGRESDRDRMLAELEERYGENLRQE